MLNRLNSVGVLHSKILDAPPESKFFQFHAVFWGIFGKIVCCPPPRGLAPSPWRNPGSATTTVLHLSTLPSVKFRSPTVHSPLINNAFVVPAEDCNRIFVFNFRHNWICSLSGTLIRVHFTWTKDLQCCN